MAFVTNTYNADEVLIYFDGIQAQGFADGEFITIEQMADQFTSVVGSDGEVARSKTNDRRVKVTLKLLQTSSTNAQLSAALNNDLNSPNGSGIGTCSVQDLNGASICSGSSAWITKMPDESYDRGAKSREWVIEIANGNRTVGGN